MFETAIKNLDAKVSALFCRNCQKETAPAWQIRIPGDECGQKQDTIAFNCSVCGADDYVPDDLSILDAEEIL